MTNGFAAAKYQPMKSHEDILIFGNGKVTYNPQMTQRTENELKRFSYKSKITTKSEHRACTGTTGNRFDNVLKYPNSIININGIVNSSNEKLPHPTQKPVSLMEYLILTYSNEFNIVVDNCMGSGTTGIACKNLNRSFIGIELNEDYFNMAKKRIETHNVQSELF